MNPSIPGDTNGKLVGELIRAAVLGFAFGSLLFVLSDQTGVVGHVLHSLGLHEAAKHLGVKQLALFGIVLGVTVDLVVKLGRRGRHLLSPLFGQEH